MKTKGFWETVEKCKKEVTTWPKWKRKIVINSKNAMSGNFYERVK